MIMSCRRITSRALSLALACTVLITVLLPVTATAAEGDSAWVELLNTETVNGQGNNVFAVGSSATISVPSPQYSRYTKIDLLVSHPSGYKPTSVRVTYNGVSYSLTLISIDAYTTRAYGTIANNLYADVRITFGKSTTTTSYYQLLSCKVLTVKASDFAVAGYTFFDSPTYSDSIDFGTLITAPGDGLDTVTSYPYQARITIAASEWKKYDSLTFWGSVDGGSVNSVRASIGTKALDFDFSYADSESADVWYEYAYDETPSWGVSGYGKTLYAGFLDLAEMDRTSTDILVIYITGNYDSSAGMTFNCQYCSGTVQIADTADASLWARFTDFMTDLFGGDSPDADDYASTMESQSQQMQDAVDAMGEVTRPAVEDIEVSIDGYVDADSMTAVGDIVGGIMGNELILSMVMISLILSLAAYIVFGKR